VIERDLVLLRYAILAETQDPVDAPLSLLRYAIPVEISPLVDAVPLNPLPSHLALAQWSLI